MEYKNASYDTTLDTYVCPKCGEKLTLLNEPPAICIYCKKCNDAQYDDETGEYMGKMSELGGWREEDR